ncbi:FixH family protein [Anaerobacillus alkaliphilus]|nr:FixH family protein [Anaerobacillus alkaliphilus]
MKVIVEKNTIIKSILIIVAAFFILSAANYYFTSQIDHLEDLTVELHSKNPPIKQGDRTIFQVLVYDKNHTPVENVKVEIKLTSKLYKTETLNRKFVHIEDGLYETDLQFFHHGEWEVAILLKKGLSKISKPFDLLVEK